jgi:hypothetical protein
MLARHHLPPLRPRIVIYPGEATNAKGTVVGHLYVFSSERVKRYDAVGGPPPGKGYKDGGGHSAGVTPAGHYILDHAEHHSTKNWPQSVVPWGAPIRDNNGIIEYQVRGAWKPASGRLGEVTHAIQLFARRSGKTIGLMQADEVARDMFFSNGVLIPFWNKNDFGNWSWNLKKAGHRTAYYIHTTPDDEAATAAGKAFELVQSHGCVHLRPLDRDEMIMNKALKAGVEVEVKPYGLVGPR